MGRPSAAAAPSSAAAGSGHGGASSGDVDLAADRHRGQYALRKLYHGSNRLLAVVYTSPTCGPCRTLKPIFNKVIDEFPGKVGGGRVPSCQEGPWGNCRVFWALQVGMPTVSFGVRQSDLWALVPGTPRRCSCCPLHVKDAVTSVCGATAWNGGLRACVPALEV